MVVSWLVAEKIESNILIYTGNPSRNGFFLVFSLIVCDFGKSCRGEATDFAIAFMRDSACVTFCLAFSRNAPIKDGVLRRPLW